VELTKPVEIGPVQVAIHYLNHPGVAVGFRISAGGKSVVYVSDHEPFNRMVNGEAGEAEEAKVVEFARDADLWIREAQYTEEEYASKKGWGHSTFDDALRSAAAAEVRRLAIFHHDPMHDDDFMDSVMATLSERVRSAGYSLICTAAKEGDIIDL
jgi:ribonuclease BN (tRNA processing enzyme)